MLWLSVIILLLFIPIPIKLTVVYKNKKIKLNIFNREIKLNKKSEDKRINKEKLSKNSKFDLWLLKNFISYLDDSSIKLNLSSKMNLDIGIDDSAYLGIICGTLNLLNYPIYRILSIPFKVTKFSFNITPHFNESVLSFENISIIYVNLVKIIYIVFKSIYFYIKTLYIRRS